MTAEVIDSEVTTARLVEQDSDMGWHITVRPDSNSVVGIVLPATIDCDGHAGICTGDERMLSSRLELTVGGPDG